MGKHRGVEGRTGAEEISAEDARELIAGPDSVQVLDLRPQEEFAESHITGAANVNPDDLDSAASGLSESERVIVVCTDGQRSGEIAATLCDQGFDAASVEGGMDSWTSDKLPVQPREKEEFHGPRRPGPLGQ
jgi:rhodanese-related sulfurtransferase